MQIDGIKDVVTEDLSELVAAGGGYGASSLMKRALTADRYVAYLDIMGFKDRVARRGHNEILSELQQFSEYISSNLKGIPDITFVMFSDSFLFFTEHDDAFALKQLVSLLAGVMNHAIGNRIPIKGVLAKGTFTVDVAKQLFFGQPLIDAYGLEENLVIYGIAIHHTLEKEAKNMPEWFVDKDVPLKNGNSKHYLLKWWDEGDSKRAEDSLNAIRETVSDAPRRYIDKTIYALLN